MADALALYRSVMGQVWDDEQRRAGAARDAGAARQGRGRRRRPVAGRGRGWSGGHGWAGGPGWGGLGGRPSAQDLMRAAAGGRAAVFKRIRAGGCRTPRALRDQLSYVNDKAVFVTSTLIPEPEGGAVLSPAEKMEIVDAFTDRWAGTTKLGHTSHMLLSFPLGVSTEVVRDVAVEWAERLFESGHYGDTWDYVLAVHDDREHRHAHVVLNNRGRDHGTWFSCWREGAMSPQHMRELQAEIAAEHGVMLEATGRLERGLATEPATIQEVYAARDERRPRREIEPDVVRGVEARAAHARFAAEQWDLADLLDDHDHGALARATRAMAESVSNGRPWEAAMAARTAGAISVDEVRTVGDAIEWAEERWARLDEEIAGLEPRDRARFEVQAAEIKGDLAELLPGEERRREWTTTMRGSYPPGAELAGVDTALRREGLAQARPEAVEGVLQEGRGLGLDVEEMAGRLEAGGTLNQGLAQEWTDRDVARILARDGMDPAVASDPEIEEATATLDGFQDRLRGAMLEAGAEERQVLDLAAARAVREVEREGGLDAAPSEPGAEVPGARQGAEAGPWMPDEDRLDRIEELVGELRGMTREITLAAGRGMDRDAERQAEVERLASAYLADQPDLLRLRWSTEALLGATAPVLSDGPAQQRVAADLAEWGLSGWEDDAQPRVAAALVAGQPDMPTPVAQDLAFAYVTTAFLMAERDRGAEVDAFGVVAVAEDAITGHLDRQDPVSREPEVVSAIGRAREAAQGVEYALVDGRAEATPASDQPLQALAERLRREDLAPEEREEVAAALGANLERRLGVEAMARLDSGDHGVLEGIVPMRDRITIVEARRDLGRELSDGAEAEAERSSGRDRELDDDMEL